MPTIILKHKSPEFADVKQDIGEKSCDMPGCCVSAEHKAPKHRGLNEYYHFCFDHAKDYNKAWDFFYGMSEHEVQNHMNKSLYGDRPTWKYAGDESAEEALLRAAQHSYGFGDEGFANAEKEKEQAKRSFNGDTSTPEYEAMAIMGLSPPLTLDEIKTQYKKLAKKYHPDLNKNDPKAEELLKRVNMAYTILKLAFQEYNKLPDAGAQS